MVNFTIPKQTILTRMEYFYNQSHCMKFLCRKNLITNTPIPDIKSSYTLPANVRNRECNVPDTCTTTSKTRHFRIPKTLPAFSLSELLVVLVIIGILVLIALPNLMPLISRAKSTEAQQQLSFLHTLQKSHFYTHSRYSDSPQELGFEQQRLVTDGGAANYIIEITEASERGFTATATAVVDFDGNGVFNVWEIDQDKQLRETVKD